MIHIIDIGFLRARHFQIGNIYVDEHDDVKLGGYDMALFGYKTRMYKSSNVKWSHVDLLMFGRYPYVFNVYTSHDFQIKKITFRFDIPPVIYTGSASQVRCRTNGADSISTLTVYCMVEGQSI